MSPPLPRTCAKVIIARQAAATHFQSEGRTKLFDQNTYPLVTSKSLCDMLPQKFGVVSLFDMLEFSARDYVELSYQLGLLLASMNDREVDSISAGERLGALIAETRRLGLRVTKEHIDEMMAEVFRDNPNCLKAYRDGDDAKFEFELGNIELSRICHHLEGIYVSMRAELGAIIFRAIPLEKSKFCDSNWLAKTPMDSRFPETVDEFRRAGRCFAYGENTACIFHLMRVADFYFKKVAESLHITYDARNWHGIGEKITEKMEQKYQAKTNDWKKQESFYAEILMDIQAISRAHRNPVLHELEKKYDEREALNMLAIIEGFATHVAQNLAA